MTNKFNPRIVQESDTYCSTAGCTNYCIINSKGNEESTKCGICIALAMLQERISALEMDKFKPDVKSVVALLGHDLKLID